MMTTSLSCRWFGCSARCPRIEPALERLLALTRRPTSQQVLHADVFINIRPVNSTPRADEAPALTLFHGGVGETRVPRQRRGDRATVRELDRQRVVADDDVDSGRRPGFNWRRTRSTGPRGTRHSLRQAPEYGPTRYAGSRGYVEASRERARTWLLGPPVPRAHGPARHGHPSRRRTDTVRT
jgi:hypothetical protein